MPRKTNFLFVLTFLAVLSTFFLTISCGQAQPSYLSFEISFSAEAHPKAITGRVYVMLTKNEKYEPRLQISTHGIPFFGKDISGLKPGQTEIIDENEYRDKNAYYKDFGWVKVPTSSDRSPAGIVRLTNQQRNQMELAMGTKNRSGEQIDIFEAVYGPIGPDGYVKPLFNKRTGEIDPEVAEYWKDYDIHSYLKKNWSWLGPKLKGKLHIYIGDMDTFYLNNAVVLLEEFLESTKNPYYDGTVEYADRKPHCWGPRGAELLKLFEEHISENAPPGEDTSLWKY